MARKSGASSAPYTHVCVYRLPSPTAAPLSPSRTVRFVVVAVALSSCDAVGAPPEPPQIDVTLDGYELTWEQVEDGAVNSGELVILDAFVTNASGSTYTGLDVAVDDAPGDLRSAILFDEDRLTAPFGPGECRRFTVEARFAPDRPAGTPVRIGVRLGHPSGAELALPLDFEVAPLPYEPEVRSWAVVEDADMDGLVAPGEGGVVVAFDVGGPPPCFVHRVTSPVPEVTIRSGGTGSCPRDGGARRVSFRVSSTFAGREIPFDIAVADGLSNTWGFAATVGME